MTNPTLHGPLDDAHRVLRDRFGFDTFREGQAEVLTHLLSGRSAAAVFPTGGGKSLCYQIPSLLLPGLTLVISPLIALMKDQIDALTRRNIRACRLDSTATAEESRETMKQIRDGSLSMLYVAPERFANERFRQAIRSCRLSLFAIDEAHCVSEWGHNFRPDYLKLASYARDFGAERVLALTATATRQVLEDVVREFEIEPECAVRTGFHRQNLSIHLTPLERDRKDPHLLERLESRTPGATIVYVTQQKTAEGVASRLANAGYEARAYHAGLPDQERTAIQNWFLESREGIVVATIAFGMGVDKADIRYVYHYDLPKSLENYSQEIGRSGRDGHDAFCEAMICQDDLFVLENFIYGDTPPSSAVHEMLKHLFSLGDRFAISFFTLSTDFDIRILVVRTLLTVLEIEGYLEGGTPYYAGYRFKPLVAGTAILERFSGEERRFVHSVLSQSKKGRTWFQLDVDAITTSLDVPRERVLELLDSLAERELLEIKTDKIRYRYRVRRHPDDLGRLASSIDQRMRERERAELDRLGQVLSLTELDGCQASHLGAHFDEPLPSPCGRCSYCQRGTAVELLPRSAATIAESTLHEAEIFFGERPDVFSNVETKTRFLCGIRTPRLSKARLGSHRLFGAMGDVSYRDVMAKLQSL